MQNGGKMKWLKSEKAGKRIKSPSRLFAFSPSVPWHRLDYLTYYSFIFIGLT